MHNKHFILSTKNPLPPLKSYQRQRAHYLSYHSCRTILCCYLCNRTGGAFISTRTCHLRTVLTQAGASYKTRNCDTIRVRPPVSYHSHFYPGRMSRLFAFSLVLRGTPPIMNYEAYCRPISRLYLVLFSQSLKRQSFVSKASFVKPFRSPTFIGLFPCTGITKILLVPSLTKI